MKYTERYLEMRSVFDPGITFTDLNNTGSKIINIPFTSENVASGLINNEDIRVNENISFSYPVFIPPGNKSRKAILLMHGLNERNWTKYLAWAYTLSVETGSYVILFPLSFHINRTPESWKDPRVMNLLVNERKSVFGEVMMSNFANIALSHRLTEDPKRFFCSGYQTACDIVNLMKQIRDGRHKVIPGGSRVNIFAYSIGAFLAQIMMMGNPEGLFSESKLFIFCGGSVFSNMQGTSRLIMDSLAYQKVHSFYMNDFEAEINSNSTLAAPAGTSQVVLAFRSMIDLKRLRDYRESTLFRLKEQICSIALSGDSVIPARGILSTMGTIFRKKNKAVEVWDFPYPYSHENPFPVFRNGLSSLVDVSFEKVFAKARSFFA